MTLDEAIYALNAECDAMEREIERLNDENAKLRKLVRDMWRGSVTRMDFAERYAFIGEFADRMRELEV